MYIHTERSPQFIIAKEWVCSSHKMGQYMKIIWLCSNTEVTEPGGQTLLTPKPTKGPEPVPSTSNPLLGLPRGHFIRGFSTKILYAFLVSPVITTLPTHSKFCYPDNTGLPT